MMQWQLRIAGSRFPLALVLVLDHEGPSVVLTPLRKFELIVEPEVDGKIGAWYGGDSMTLVNGQEEEDFFYHTTYRYKDIPLLLRWLQQQNIVNPF
jgi:hypothetical protein